MVSDGTTAAPPSPEDFLAPKQGHQLTAALPAELPRPHRAVCLFRLISKILLQKEILEQPVASGGAPRQHPSPPAQPQFFGGTSGTCRP